MYIEQDAFIGDLDLEISSAISKCLASNRNFSGRGSYGVLHWLGE
jgi:hypothetical protein